MTPIIKAVVFRTPRLAATKAFFLNQLGFLIREYSTTHFVIYSKDVRLLFVEASGDLEVEIYLDNTPVEKLTVLKDPNHITIIMSKNQKNDHPYHLR
jgi:hypothetical protein